MQWFTLLCLNMHGIYYYFYHPKKYFISTHEKKSLTNEQIYFKSLNNAWIPGLPGSIFAASKKGMHCIHTL